MARKPAHPGKGKAPHHAPVHPRHKMSPAQYRAYLHYIRTHFQNKAKPKKPGKPRKAIGAARGTSWILAANDDLETCTIAAIANSLRYWKGITARDDELLSFGESLDLATALKMTMMFGMSGARLRRASMVPGWTMKPGDIAGMMIESGPHAALYLGAGNWASWGGVIRLDDESPEIEEVWQLDWR